MSRLKSPEVKVIGHGLGSEVISNSLGLTVAERMSSSTVKWINPVKVFRG